MKIRKPHALPIPAGRALRKLGRDIRDARRRRRIAVAIMAERTYATVLFVLGMVERLGDLADARYDAVGRELEEERLPQRIRRTRRQKSTGPEPPTTE